ncbi:hypothetical protein [Desertivirga arenae]|uniref:hypothetical protein n=1 Tax=Desertivirga arenae TaxID=2810309 RepID=UPI001A95C806|nr:hypothetical protein [Pedobacter sp. SYSU D00823]
MVPDDLSILLIEYLKQWFNRNEKTRIVERYREKSISFDKGYIVIDVESVNVNYWKYFQKENFDKNADLLVKKLCDVVKDWMVLYSFRSYHFKVRIRNGDRELQKQGLLRL